MKKSKINNTKDKNKDKSLINDIKGIIVSKPLLLIIPLIIIIILAIFITNGNRVNIDGDKNVIKTKRLNVTFVNGNKVEIDKINTFEATKEIIIKNNTKEYAKYYLKWKDVDNTIDNQSAFTFDVKGTGEGALELGKSQVPNSGGYIFRDIIITPGVTQKYVITLSYDKSNDNSNKDGSFKGELEINEYDVELVENKKSNG